MSYADFLAAKARHAPSWGRAASSSEVHPLLYEWQARIVAWAVRQGRAAVFADCGLGKTFIQLEWARLSADKALILAPLSVARQTVREAQRIGLDVRYVREQPKGEGLFITNYEMADNFDPSSFGAVVLDESSILKNVDGKTRRRLTEQLRDVPARLACTATPAPNDVAELTNHAEFLGIMPRVEMLAAYFVHDQDGWRLKGHAAEPMYRWMASWAVALRKPSDLGYDDEGFALPPLHIVPEVVHVQMRPEGQLFATDLGGIGGRHAVRKETLPARVQKACDLAADGAQWIVWCGLNDEAGACAAGIAGAVNVEGSWSPDAKAEALEAFQDGRIRVLVTKPSIAGFGMNFQNAHRMAFVGLSDSYESYYQAIRRCWRFGQTKPVYAHVIVSELEAQIVANVQRKENDAERSTSALVRHMRLDEEVAV